MPEAAARPLRRDLAAIASMIEPGSRVLDVGSGDGTLLDHLKRTRDVSGRGIELSQAGVNAAVARGLSVVQGDADSDLADYPSGVFDYVILSQTIQATWRPKRVLEEMLRIGRRGIVSFPNFGHWRARLHLLTRGRMPVTPELPESWHETANIHLCTVADFVDLVGEAGGRVERALALTDEGGTWPFRPNAWWPNFRAQSAVLLLSQAH